MDYKIFFSIQNIIIVVLLILLSVSFTYIFTNYITQKKQVQDQEVFNQGKELGYKQAIVEIIQKAVTCEFVPLYVGNQSINLLAIECINQEKQSLE
jgi:hypothetical protein